MKGIVLSSPRPGSNHLIRPRGVPFLRRLALVALCRLGAGSASLFSAGAAFLLILLVASSASAVEDKPSRPRHWIRETAFCTFSQKTPCEVPFGTKRRLRVPNNLLHPSGVSRVETPVSDYESGLVQTTYGHLRMTAGQTAPAADDDAIVQIRLSSEPRDTALHSDSLSLMFRPFAPERLEALEEARRSDTLITFTDRIGREHELLFRGGKVVTRRECQAGYGGSVGICRVTALRGGVVFSFWFDRRVQPTTEDAVALVLVLMNSFVIQGPSFE